jgi:hypothetical protein
VMDRSLPSSSSAGTPVVNGASNAAPQPFGSGPRHFPEKITSPPTEADRFGRKRIIDEQVGEARQLQDLKHMPLAMKAKFIALLFSSSYNPL